LVIEKQIEREILKKELEALESSRHTIYEQLEALDVQKEKAVNVTALDVVCWIVGLIVMISPFNGAGYVDNLTCFLLGISIISTSVIRSTAHRAFTILAVISYFILLMALPFFFTDLTMPDVQFQMILNFMFFINVVSIVNPVVAIAVSIAAMSHAFGTGLKGRRQHPGLAVAGGAVAIAGLDFVVGVILSSPNMDFFVIATLPAETLAELALMSFSHMIIYLVAMSIAYAVIWLIGRTINAAYNMTKSNKEATA